MTTAISFGYKSDAGRRRETNEDSCAVLNRAQLNGRLDGLMIVGDGLGGRRAGEVASSLLVETISLGVLETTAGRLRPLAAPDVEQLLLDTIVRANGKIMTAGRFQERSDARGMATTCVTAIINDNVITIGNVGDSRIYLLRSGELVQLTQDHSEVFKEFVKGNLTETEARNHRFRNQITRAVGLEPNVRPDISSLPLVDGDTLLLCSDGLTTEIPDRIIADALAASPTAQDACDLLVSVALRHGGRDNVTVVVMRYGDFSPTGPFETDFPLQDEEDTDPNQDWRNEARTDDDLRWAEDDRSEDAEESAFEPKSASRDIPYRPGSPASVFAQYALAVICLLILGLLVEGAMIYNLSHPSTVTQDTKPKPPVPEAAIIVHAYDAPRLLLDTPVISDILQLSAKGNPIVATMDGSLQTYLMSEKKLLPMRGVIPLLPETSNSNHHVVHGKSHRDVYSDPSGNLYYLNPDTKCIETYTSTGTRTNQDLGKGSLVAPTKLIVDSFGAIFVIDDNHLKVIPVKADRKVAAHPANANF